MSLKELETKIAKNNPKPLFKTINEIEIELSDTEYEESIKACALMIHQQENPDLYVKENGTTNERSHE